MTGKLNTNDSKIGTVFTGRDSVKQADKFACCAVGKGTKRDLPSKCGRQMATTSKRARIAARRFLVIGG